MMLIQRLFSKKKENSEEEKVRKKYRKLDYLVHGASGAIDGAVAGGANANLIKGKPGNTKKGMAIGAAVGAGVGVLGSKSVDLVRGKIKMITDKAKAQGKFDFGKNYLATGKGFRGIRSEEDINRITNNWKEFGSYAKGIYDSI